MAKENTRKDILKQCISEMKLEDFQTKAKFKLAISNKLQENNVSDEDIDKMYKKYVQPSTKKLQPLNEAEFQKDVFTKDIITAYIDQRLRYKNHIKDNDEELKNAQNQGYPYKPSSWTGISEEMIKKIDNAIEISNQTNDEKLLYAVQHIADEAIKGLNDKHNKEVDNAIKESKNSQEQAAKDVKNNMSKDLESPSFGDKFVALVKVICTLGLALLSDDVKATLFGTDLQKVAKDIDKRAAAQTQDTEKQYGQEGKEQEQAQAQAQAQAVEKEQGIEQQKGKEQIDAKLAQQASQLGVPLNDQGIQESQADIAKRIQILKEQENQIGGMSK